ncbi:hypothetical protein ACEPAF_6951 [Sanghuangporus sanghuang]
MFAAHRHALVTRRIRPCLASTSRLQPNSSSHHLPRPSGRRTLWISALEPFREGFLDLALALPWPVDFPPYASTIILTTVISRILFTLPFSIWAKKRQWRLEEAALPELIAYRKKAAVRIANEMKFAGYAKRGIENFRNEHIKRLQRALETRQNEIFKKHSCSPRLTMLIPAVSQLPLFVFSTAIFSSIATRPTPLDDESFLTLTSLARSDPTGTLPVVLGLVTLANVETAGWFVGVERAGRTAAIEARRQEEDTKTREAGGIVKPRTKNVVQSSLRMLSIVRIVVGIMVDGSVLVYWLSSATFGLFQSWAFNWWDARRAAQRSRLSTQKASIPKRPLPSSTTPKTSKR